MERAWYDYDHPSLAYGQFMPLRAYVRRSFNVVPFPIKRLLDFERWTVLSYIFGLDFSDILLRPGTYMKF